MVAPPRIGRLESGPRDTLCDVPGVAVGHCTLAEGDVQTGVTVVRPHPEDLFLGKRPPRPPSSTASARAPGSCKSRSWGPWRPPSP